MREWNQFKTCIKTRSFIVFHFMSLYSTHVPTSSLQKVLLAVGSAVIGLKDPMRGDMIATLGETSGAAALVEMNFRMKNDAVGRQILRDKPLVTDDLIKGKRLLSFPKNSFGYAYGSFLHHYGYRPDERAPVRFVDNVELAYVMLRYRQVHDFFHVLTGLNTSVTGEIAVKWLEMMQTQLPMTALSAFFGPLATDVRNYPVLYNDLIPWAIRNGRNATFLLNVYYEKELETPTAELRKRLNLTPPPAQFAFDWNATNL
eukprot:GILJ01005785.1.p1 GENE.GILJ01005785.1~~GILJ01005785.1.p1  ORF type:complete len:258 (-),score=33.85 GILJ01005785.1:165-938(-)